MNIFKWIWKTNKLLVFAFFFMLIFTTSSLFYAIEESDNNFEIFIIFIIPFSGTIALINNMISLYRKNNK